MLDMIGKTITEGDSVMYVGGNARYGGLKFIVGVVTRMTPKRISLMTAPLIDDGKLPKIVAKTSHKVLKCPESLNEEIETIGRIRLFIKGGVE